MELNCRRCENQIKGKDIDIHGLNAFCESCNFLFDVTDEIYEQRRIDAKVGRPNLRTFDIKDLTHISDKPDKSNGVYRRVFLRKNKSIECEYCNESIPGKNINYKNSLALCAQCNQIDDFLPALNLSVREYYGLLKENVTKPQNLEEFSFPDEHFYQFENTKQNDRSYFITQVLFVFAFIIVGIATEFYIGLLFYVPFLLFYIYRLVANFFNKSLVRITNDHIQIKQAPIPVLMEKKVKREDVSQLYCRPFSWRRLPNKEVNWDYALCLIDKDGNEKILISGIESSQTLLYIERKIEEIWGIRDFPIVEKLRSR